MLLLCVMVQANCGELPSWLTAADWGLPLESEMVSRRTQRLGREGALDHSQVSSFPVLSLNLAFPT